MTGPIAGVSASGLATAGAVYQDTPSSIRAQFQGYQAMLGLNILDIDPDNFGLYAADGKVSGPGGSLWRVAEAVCAESRPDRIVIVDPPLAPPHAEAIVGLACGDATRAKIVGREQVEDAIKGHTVVIAFPNGSAEIEQRT